MSSRQDEVNITLHIDHKTQRSNLNTHYLERSTPALFCSSLLTTDSMAWDPLRLNANGTFFAVTYHHLNASSNICFNLTCSPPKNNFSFRLGFLRAYKNFPRTAAATTAAGNNGLNLSYARVRLHRGVALNQGIAMSIT